MRLSLCLGLLIAVHAAAVAFFLITPKSHQLLAPEAIKPEHGIAYVAPIYFPKHLLYQFCADASKKPTNSNLQLFENGRPLGPAHSLHKNIRDLGNGRFSHWQQAIVFAASDNSDPRRNGRRYTLAAYAAVKLQWQIPILAALLVADLFFFTAFRRRIEEFFRAQGTRILLVAGAAAIAAAGLVASGTLGTVVLARSGLPKDANLVVAAILHACLGCVLSLCIWAAGAGLIRLGSADRRARLGAILIPAFPLAMGLLATLDAISLTVPHGRLLALLIWSACCAPLIKWRPPAEELRAAANVLVAIIPFALIFGTWLALLWHGPTATLPGNPSGDLSHYAGIVWTLAAHPFPFIDLAYEQGVVRGYFNNLFPALGAGLLPLPGFDPLLFLTAAGGASYLLFSIFMLHVYLTESSSEPLSTRKAGLLILSLLAAARFPYWVVASIPVVHVPALTISVWWMTQRGKRAIKWSFAAIFAGLTGSMLSKVVTAPVLTLLGLTNMWGRIRRLPQWVQIATLGLGVVLALYCAAMLLHYLPLFATAPLGPESLQQQTWYFICRDLAAVLFVILAWRITDPPTAMVLSLGMTTVLGYAWIFQVNFIVVVLITGLIMTTRAKEDSTSWRLAFTALILSLPAAVLSDSGGVSSGIVWIVTIGASCGLAITFRSRPEPDGATNLSFRQAGLIAAMTCAFLGLGLVAVGRGFAIVDSGWRMTTPELTPDLRDIWSAVRRVTPPDCLIFTDQVNDTANVLGGWNTYAMRGQRQIFISSFYTSFELRNNPAKLHHVLKTNEDVLNGTVAPAQIETQHKYSEAFAVVSISRKIPKSWQPVYSNHSYAIYEISP